MIFLRRKFVYKIGSRVWKQKRKISEKNNSLCLHNTPPGCHLYILPMNILEVNFDAKHWSLYLDITSHETSTRRDKTSLVDLKTTSLFLGFPISSHSVTVTNVCYSIELMFYYCRCCCSIDYLPIICRRTRQKSRTDKVAEQQLLTIIIHN